MPDQTEKKLGWSRILDTDLGRAARAAYTADPARSYHNWDHVLRLYWHAENTYQLPYDPDLDKAILAHDVIYDACPDKEIRSADWLSAQSGADETAAGAHIAKTIAHQPSDDNRMVLLDLADFLHPELVTVNLDKIATEAQALYGITEAQFLSANKAFMTQLIAQISDRQGKDLSEEDAAWFDKILVGMRLSIDLVTQRLAAAETGKG